MSKGGRKSYLFLNFAIPDEEMEKVFRIDNFPQVQSHKFNWNLIKGLEYLDEFDITYISSRPVSDYPIFPQKKIKKNKWIINIANKEIKIQEIPFINVSVLKLITRFFSALFYSFKIFHSKQNKAGVIVYSVHVPYMIVGLIISKIYNIDYIAIWTDPPAVRYSRDSGLKSKLRSIELKLSKYLMSKVTKVIALTKYLAEDFAPGKPYLVMEGIINPNDINYLPKMERNFSKEPIKIVYTGSLEKRYGIKNIVNGFLSMKNKNAILEIYGRGDFEDELVDISKMNPNVIYKGFIPNTEILKVQREADFLINARSDKEEFVKYSFPSKTLEYMLSGTPLITTMLPGIPEEYRDYVIVLDNNNPETITKKLDEVLKYSSYERNQIGLKALKFAESKNYINQARKIIDFIKQKPFESK
jgi:glycosyltransferase involved in cell wall biosynthesis